MECLTSSLSALRFAGVCDEMTQNQCLGRCAGSKTLLRLGHPEILQVDTVAVSLLLFRKGKISCSAVD